MTLNSLNPCLLLLLSALAIVIFFTITTLLARVEHKLKNLTYTGDGIVSPVSTEHSQAVTPKEMRGHIRHNSKGLHLMQMPPRGKNPFSTGN
jgi:hypothetical protein